MLSTAGTDTSRYTLMWVLIYMARNPECQKKLQNEINEVAGQYVFILEIIKYYFDLHFAHFTARNELFMQTFRNNFHHFFVVGKQPLTMADRSQLHYTNAVLHETMRIRTLAPFSLPHKTTCDTTIGKH